VTHLTFRDLLTAFAAAVEANDGEGFASLFTEDGTYEDGFFGAHTGRPAIAMMLQRFHDTGRAYLWEFLDPLSDGSIGYARFRFSYASLLPEAAGRPVFFEGMSCFRFRDGLIAHYGAAFDRGVAPRSARVFGRAHQTHSREGCNCAKPQPGNQTSLSSLFRWVNGSAC
jgi:hypothetical protein